MEHLEESLASTFSSTAFALQDGLIFIKYAAQAIAQDEFSKCFMSKPRTSKVN
jgi:hypothetical protein